MHPFLKIACGLSVIFMAPLLLPPLARADAPFASVAESRAALLQGEFHFDPKMIGVHPRLLIDPTALAALRKIDLTPYAMLTAQKDFLTRPTEPLELKIHGWDDTRQIFLASTLYLLTGNEARAATVHRWITEAYAPGFVTKPNPIVIASLGTENKDLAAGGFLFSTALIYDNLKGSPDYAAKYPGDLEVLEKALLAQGAQTYTDLQTIPNIWYEQNHFYIVAAALGMTALALYDEAPQHPEITQWAIWSRNATKRSREVLCSDGFYFEGVSYWSGFYHYLTGYLEALKRTTGEDALTAADGKPGFLTGLDAYLAHTSLPDPGKTFAYGDYGPRIPYTGYRSPVGEIQEQTSLVPMLQMAEMTPSPLVTLMIQKEWNDRKAYKSVYLDAMQMGLSLLKLPTLQAALDAPTPNPGSPWHYFPDHEFITWRNGWKAGENGSGVALLFKAGPPEGHVVTALTAKYPEWRLGMGHVHPDAGTFQIFTRGTFLAAAPGYSGSKMTQEHNCVLIDGHGQYKEGSTWDVFGEAPYAKYDKLHMENVWLASNVAASTGVLEAAYDDALKLQSYRRELLFIKGRWLVIRDTLVAPEAHTYTWTLNSEHPFTSVVGQAQRWETNSDRARLIVQSMSPIAKNETGPTYSNLDLANKQPEWVAREQHLSLSLAPAATGSISNVLCVQDHADNPKAFTAVSPSKGVFEITEGTDRCRVLLADATNLDGSYGYIYRAKGHLDSFGVSGRGIKFEQGALSLGVSGTVVLSREGKKWRIESNLPSASALQFKAEGKAGISINLPGGESSQLADLPL